MILFQQARQFLLTASLILLISMATAFGFASKDSLAATSITVAVSQPHSQILAMGKKDTKSDPTEGTVQLDGILDKVEETLDSPPMSMEEVEERSSGGGLNEVQGTTDKNKMNKSSDSTPPVVKDIEKALDKNAKKN